MSTMTGSFRLADVQSSGLASTMSATSSVASLPADCLAEIEAAMLPNGALDLSPAFPGLEVARKFARALQRPVQQTGTEMETVEEERLNALTHGLGFALSMIGVVYLFATATIVGGWLRVTSVGVYCTSLLLMYAASTLLHAAQRPQLKRRFQLCDHVAIYLLIAGTYTPFLCSLMQGYVGFGLLACVWTLAGVGIAIKVKHADRLGDTSPLPCLALGWLVLIAIKPLLDVLPIGGMALLVAGGISYSIGMIFYCRDDQRYFHAIWHLLVMAGTGFHFAAVLLYVAV